jgi:hypothetical protein
MWSSRNFSLSAIEFGGSGTGWKFVRSSGLRESHPRECTVTDSQMILSVAESALQYGLIGRSCGLFSAWRLFSSQGRTERSAIVPGDVILHLEVPVNRFGVCPCARRHVSL